MFDYPSFEPQNFGQSIFLQRYAATGENKWAQTVKRVVDAVCANESQEVKDRTFEIINSGRFFPGGRTLNGAGRPGWKGNLLNCYIFQPEDNVESIGDVHKAMYITACNGGGTGYNASKIRPKGANIGDMTCAAPGVVSFAKSVDGMLAQVRAGGSRRAAILGAISIDHPDTLEWIRAKQTLGALENHNISLFINDHFLDAVEKDLPWHFTFKGQVWNTYLVQVGDRKQVIPAINATVAGNIAEKFWRKTPSEKVVVLGDYPIKAKWLWEQIVESNLKCGEPGLLNESKIREDYAAESWEPFAGVNPCSEANTGHMGNCTLGSINLAAYSTSGVMDIFQMEQDIPYMVRFLDNVLTLNKYPVAEQKTAAEMTRRIGLGVMGYAHMLIDVGLKYGSRDALDFTEEIMESIRDSAFNSSIDLAKEKGVFEAFIYKPHREAYLASNYIQKLPEAIQEGIAEHGIRNAVLLSIAPTGTIGSVAGVSTSIEPIFAPAYERRWRDGEVWQSQVIMDPKFKAIHDTGADPSVCVGAYDVTPEEHMKTIVCVQQFIDQSISKTINVPQGVPNFSELLLKYVRGMKGVSIYMDGSRGFEPMKAIPMMYALTHFEDAARMEMATQDCATGSCDL